MNKASLQCAVMSEKEKLTLLDIYVLLYLTLAKQFVNPRW